MNTTTRRLSFIKAYTVLESLIVLGILIIVTMVVVAIFRYDGKTDQGSEATVAAGLSQTDIDISQDQQTAEVSEPGVE